MAEALILEFNGIGRTEYEAVNSHLDLDVHTGTGNWPDGLLFHAAGAKPGGLVVFELWESQEDQGRFMSERLGKALQEGGITEPPARVEWLEDFAHINHGA
jgi:hypothetical protein